MSGSHCSTDQKLIEFGTPDNPVAFFYTKICGYTKYSAQTQDISKTVLSSALVRASAARRNTVFYLKPVTTGPVQDADDEYVVLAIGILTMNHVGMSSVSPDISFAPIAIFGMGSMLSSGCTIDNT